MRTLAAVLALATMAPPAAAELYRRDPPRLALGLGADVALASADDAFEDLRPPLLFAFSGALHVSPGLAFGVVVRAAIADSDADHIEVLGLAEASWVDEPRLPDPPALRLASSLEVGWRHLDLTGSDFVVIDDSVIVALAGEIGVVVFEDVALNLRLQVLAGSHSNDVLDAFAPELRAGLVLRSLL